MNAILLGVLAYVVVQLLVGVWISRRISSEADYLLAGRSLGFGLATFSMFATWFGAETCIGAAGRFYQDGMAGGVTDPFGYALALFLVGAIFAMPLWKRGLTTLADLFKQRYGAGAERFAALIMAPTSIFWAAAQIRAFGHVLAAAGNISSPVAITIATVVVIAYTCTGGLLADVYTDLIQGIAIIVGLGVLLVVLALNPALDFAEAWRTLDPARLNFFGGNASVMAKIDLWLLTIVGSLVAQELIARVLATRSPQIARRAAGCGALIYLSVGLVPAFLGLLGPAFLPGLADGETFLPELAGKYLPPFVFVLFTGALVSAILSTVDSTLLAASSLVSHNFIVSLRPGLNDRQRLLAARAGVVVFGLVAYALALGTDSVFELVQQANGVGSSGIFVLMAFGLFSGFGGSRAALAALIAGTGTWVATTYIITDLTAPYLLSLMLAGAAFVCAGLTERNPGRAPAAAS